MQDRIHEEAGMTVDQAKRTKITELLAQGSREFAEEDLEIAESILTAGTERHPDSDD
jgi:hypothetical protein